MVIRWSFVVLVGTLVACARQEPESSASVSSAAVDKAGQRLDDAVAVLTKAQAKVPAQVTSRARCVVVIPSMMKGGLVVGAKHGSGFATCRTASDWSAPAPVAISGGSIGAQIGVQEVDLFMLAMNEEGRKKLLRSKLVLGADASVAAGPVGTGREKATDDAMRAELVSYSWSSGLFAGAELSGATLEQDLDTTAALYGGTKPSEQELLGGEVPIPPRARPFIDAVRAAVSKAGP